MKKISQPSKNQLFSPILAFALFAFFSINTPLLLNAQKQLYTTYKLDTLRYFAQYRHIFQLDSLNPEKKGNEAMVLLLGDQISLFQSYNKLLRDSALLQIQSNDQFKHFLNNPENRPPNPRINYRIIKNHHKNLLSYTETIIPDHYRYQEQLNRFDWQIHQEQDHWLGYTIIKATTSFRGREWIAWFAPEIPMSEGPFKFNGLPGLIVKLHDTRNHYTFDLIDIKAAKPYTMIEIPDNIRYVETTYAGYKKAYQSFRNDIINRAVEAGINAHETQIRLADNLRRRNNPIELSADD